ncbi:pseudaminic acid cytidylyltransferase [Pseudomonas sp. xss_2]|uniref:pseudaminic acid cytidylyltransferase n=1 Tax=Pseudomonas sp. xss_2 TaxID=3367215 RepID=UPI00370CB0A1
MRLAVIPARGGSKRIPRKNIKEFCGKPMIAWSIEAALKSRCFDQILVSTDDEEIAEVALKYGAQVPFMRPAELSDDYTGTIPVIAHATNWCIAQGSPVVDVCCIYATAPFIEVEDLRKGLESLHQFSADYAFSVTSYPFPIQRAIRITETSGIEMFEPGNFSKRSQDLEQAYHDAGQFYWGTAAAWLHGKMIFGPKATAVVLPRHRVQDIDTMEDWVRAELMFTAMQSATL